MNEKMKVLTLVDFNDPKAKFDPAGSDIDLTLGGATCLGGEITQSFHIVGMYKVLPRTAVSLGHPRDIHTMYGGIVYCRLDSTGGGQIVGRCRIYFADPSFNRLVMVKEWHTNSQDNSAPTDKSKNPTAVPEIPFIKEDGYVILAIKPDNPTVDVDVDVSDTDNKAIISIFEVPYEGSETE